MINLLSYDKIAVIKKNEKVFAGSGFYLSENSQPILQNVHNFLCTFMVLTNTI